MISAEMRKYPYFLIGEADAYGQPMLPAGDAIPEGFVTVSIHTTSQSVQDNVNYKNAEYMGLTHDAITDKYIIQYGDMRLKVLYVNPRGRLKQVFMVKI